MKLTDREKNGITVFVLVGILCLIYFYGLKLQGIALAKEAQRASAIEAMNPFKNINLEAKSVYVYDLVDKKVLYERHPNIVLPLASLAKIMTALVAIDHLNPEDQIKIDKESLSLIGSAGLKNGEVFTRDALLSVMLIESSNDAAHAIAKEVGKRVGGGDPIDNFRNLMNEKATEIGLTKTVFYDESGLDVSKDQAGAYGSAVEVAKTLTYAYNTHPEIFGVTSYEYTTVESNNNIAHVLENTNKSIDKIPALIFSKTGRTTLAGGNLGIIFYLEEDHPVAVVALGSTIQGRFDDVVSLVDSSIKWNQITKDYNFNKYSN